MFTKDAIVLLLTINPFGTEAVLARLEVGCGTPVSVSNTVGGAIGMNVAAGAGDIGINFRAGSAGTETWAQSGRGDRAARDAPRMLR